jgi:hypothetical protein
MIRKNFLLGLEKELQCHLPPEMELKIEKNLDILNIKQDKTYKEISNKNDF